MILCAVLDTEAGPNYVLRGYLLSTEDFISSGWKPTISDVNGGPLNILGTTAFYIRFLTYVAKFHF